MVQFPEPTTLKEYLLSIDVSAVSGALFDKGVGGVVRLHGGHTSTRTKPYRISTLNGSAHWVAWAEGDEGEEPTVKWEKKKYPDGPNPQEMLDALKKEAGL